MTGHSCERKVPLKELNKKITVQTFRPMLLNLSLLSCPSNADGNSAFDFSEDVRILSSLKKDFI